MEIRRNFAIPGVVDLITASSDEYLLKANFIRTSRSVLIFFLEKRALLVLSGLLKHRHVIKQNQTNTFRK
ncbi:hypothetical protein C900_01669 [Fulvivirga imtechensis AK7]|uniref:Uncharacterized protein n=1 Tax=Fulvivirga imtechensis AK7 TaxID=1237149 RepID=L8JYV0_9BACT|nr:hypothetical protein C900_01669 [Fulvivirga imtechensis AK7]